MNPQKKEWPTLHTAPPIGEATLYERPETEPDPETKPTLAGAAFWAMVFVSVVGIGLTLGFELRAAKIAREVATANARVAMAPLALPPPAPVVSPAPIAPASDAPPVMPQITAALVVVPSSPKKPTASKHVVKKPPRKK